MLKVEKSPVEPQQLLHRHREKVDALPLKAGNG
jgi:hypothetical protein